MKKISLFLALILSISLVFDNFALAKEPTMVELKKQVKTLTTNNKKLTTKYNSLVKENKKLKADLTSVISKKNGSIYIDGVKEGNADFVSYRGKQYVAMDGIVPALRGENYKYSTSKNALYVGISPINGAIQLQNLPSYLKNNLSINKWWGGNSFIINGQRFISGMATYVGHGNSPGYVEYKLNGKYNNLSFKVGADDSAIGGAGTGSIVIYGDGNVIYDSGTLETQEDPKVGNVDVSDVKMLRIEWLYTKGSTALVLGSPILTP